MLIKIGLPLVFIYCDVLKCCHMSVLNYISNPLKTNSHKAFDIFHCFNTSNWVLFLTSSVK